MKKMTLTLVVMMALAMTTLVSAAVGLGGRPLKATIPFAFTVAGRTMPAGQYELSQGVSPNSLTVRNFDAAKAVAVLIHISQNRGNKEFAKNQLQFHRYGSQYFLTGIQLIGESNAVLVQRSNEERRAAEELKNIAGVSAQPEIVFVNVPAAE